MEIYENYTTTRKGFFCGHCQRTLTKKETKDDECLYCGSGIACECIPQSKWVKIKGGSK